MLSENSAELNWAQQRLDFTNYDDVMLEGIIATSKEAAIGPPLSTPPHKQ